MGFGPGNTGRTFYGSRRCCSDPADTTNCPLWYSERRRLPTGIGRMGGLRAKSVSIFSSVGSRFSEEDVLRNAEYRFEIVDRQGELCWGGQVGVVKLSHSSYHSVRMRNQFRFQDDSFREAAHKTVESGQHLFASAGIV